MRSSGHFDRSLLLDRPTELRRTSQLSLWGQGAADASWDGRGLVAFLKSTRSQPSAPVSAEDFDNRTAIERDADRNPASVRPVRRKHRRGAARVHTRMRGSDCLRSFTRRETLGKSGIDARPRIALHCLTIGCSTFSSSSSGSRRNVARTSRRQSSRCAPHRTLRATSKSTQKSRRFRGVRTRSLREHLRRAPPPSALEVQSLRARSRVAPVPKRHGLEPVKLHRVVPL